MYVLMLRIELKYSFSVQFIVSKVKKNVLHFSNFYKPETKKYRDRRALFLNLRNAN